MARLLGLQPPLSVKLLPTQIRARQHAAPCCSSSEWPKKGKTQHMGKMCNPDIQVPCKNPMSVLFLYIFTETFHGMLQNLTVLQANINLLCILERQNGPT